MSDKNQFVTNTLILLKYPFTNGLGETVTEITMRISRSTD